MSKMTPLNGSNEPTKSVIDLPECNLTPLVGWCDQFEGVILDIDNYTVTGMTWFPISARAD